MQKSEFVSFVRKALPSPKKLTEISRSVGLFQRAARKVFPADLLRAVILAIADQVPHSRGIAQKIASLSGGAGPSRQAVWKRLRCESAPLFFLRAFECVLAHQILRIPIPAELIKGPCSGFARVLVEDGSIIPLHPSLAEDFVGTSNQYGTVASMRLRWVFDLISGQTIDSDLRFGRDNDMSTANDILELLREGDLLLRDMGYFCLDCFERISRAGAFYITRIPAGTTITLLDTGRSKLIGVLRRAKRDKIKELELDAEVGTDRAVRGRLVAVQISAEKAAEARRKLRQRRRAHGRQPTLAELDQCDWALVFTNVPTDRLAAADIADLYRARWAVETFFKGLKSGQGLNKWSKHRANCYALECMAIGHMILGVLSLNLWRIMGRQLLEHSREGARRPRGNHEVQAPGTGGNRVRFIGPLMAMESIPGLLEKMFGGLLRGCRLDEEITNTIRYVTQVLRKRSCSDARFFGF